MNSKGPQWAEHDEGSKECIQNFDREISWKVVTWESKKGNEDGSKMALTEEDCEEPVQWWALMLELE
jgi:hypothetical protein